MEYLSRVGVWERVDGGVSITYFASKDMLPGETEDEFLTRQTDKLKDDDLFKSATLNLILKSDVPVDRVNRNEWSLKSGKVEVDPIKVQAKADALAQKELDRQKVLDKLKITKEDLDKLGIK